MAIKDLISGLGGPSLVASKLGLTVSAVTNWQMRGYVPPGHSLALWRLALEANLDWTPPEAEAIQGLLKAAEDRAPVVLTEAV